MTWRLEPCAPLTARSAEARAKVMILRKASRLLLPALISVVVSGCNVDWLAYLGGPTHSSYNSAAGGISPPVSAALTRVWHLGGTPFYNSPVVHQRRVYIGGFDGYFYAINEDTGDIVWKRFIGTQPLTTCGSQCLFPPTCQPNSCQVSGAYGFVASAAVATDPNSKKATVYLAAADGYLYALLASDGTQIWKSPVGIPSADANDYLNWSSPTVTNGNIYIGVTSFCDCPLVQGGLREYDQASGNLLNSFQTNPAGDLGGDIWSTAAVGSDGSVFVTTGNAAGAIGASDSIIKLDGSLKKLDVFTVPAAQQIADGDFGASATLWSATISGIPTAMVGALNKNGVFYALRSSNLAAGPVWTYQIGQPQLDGISNDEPVAAAVWDSSLGRLFLSGNASPGGVAHQGTVARVDPATGAPIWQMALPGSVVGTPSLNAGGVLAVGTFNAPQGSCNAGSSIGHACSTDDTDTTTGCPDAMCPGCCVPHPEAVYLLDALTGQLLGSLNTDNQSVPSQPVFADNYVLVATFGGLYAYQVAPQPGGLSRYYNTSTGDHASIVDGPSSGYQYEQTFGSLLTTPQAGTTELFTCMTTTHGQPDDFTSTSSSCGNSGVLFPLGWAYTNVPPGIPSVPLYGCHVTGTGEHFDSRDSACEGQTIDSLFGYLVADGVFTRYSNGLTGDHLSALTPAPAGYQYDAAYGRLLTASQAGTTQVFACQTGGDEFTSTSAVCEGYTVLASLGWAYTVAPAGIPSVPLYRCHVASTGERFDSPDAQCEGYTQDYRLGYLVGDVNLSRYYNSITGDHYTRPGPLNPPSAGYEYEKTLGSLLTAAQSGTAQLFACQAIGGEEFTSTDSNCEGSMVLAVLGWIYSARPSGFASVPLYRCHDASRGDRFDSTDSACENFSPDYLLGYLLATGWP